MPVYTDDRVSLYHGDCLDVLAGLGDACVDAVVTDPPYGLEFMGKDWDAPWRDERTDKRGVVDPDEWGGSNPYSRARIRTAAAHYGGDPAAVGRSFQRWCEMWAAECLRVLKPGGHLLSFGGTRTWHRLACAVEDAGFEVRDSIAWLYGSGFPKSLDVSKAIDRAAGELKPEGVAFNVAGNAHNDKLGAPPTSGYAPPAPVTPGAVKWQGWGTALKPAFEPIVVARKPLAGTVAANVLAHGTGALNIDGCRVSTTDKLGGGANKSESNDTRHEGYNRPWRDDPEAQRAKAERSLENTAKAEDLGRWPSNAVLDAAAAAEVDRQSGFTKDGTAVHGNHKPDTGGYGSTIGYVPGAPDAGYGGAGGASRFFPVFRDEDERRWPPNVVLDEGAAAGVDEQSGVTTNTRHMSYKRGGGEFVDGIASQPERGWHVTETGGASRYFPTFRYQAKASTGERPEAGGVAHPTVKPLELMRWLVRLVTPPGGTVLEPFAGSGTTAEACVHEHRNCIAIEREGDYIPLIVARLTKPMEVGFDFDGAGDG